RGHALADCQWLRRVDGRPADGARYSRAHQKAVGGRSAVRSLKGRRPRARRRRQGRAKPRQARLPIPRWSGDTQTREAAGAKAESKTPLGAAAETQTRLGA